MTKTAIAKNNSIPSTAVNQSTEMQTTPMVNQPKPAKRHRIPAPQRIRVMELYALGKNQTQIAREERLNRETVHKIVNGSEMGEFIEEMRSSFRGLSELALEALRASLEQRGKEAIEIAWRVLESNGIIPPRGQADNYSTQLQDASANEENEAVQKTLSAFGRIAMERAKVFNTPFPELEEAAEQAGVDLKKE